MKKKNKSGQGGMVYSTNPDYNFDNPFADLNLGYSKEKDLDIRIWLDRKKGNKIISRATGFNLKNDDLQAIKKELQGLCGSGGSAKDQEVLIQGDHRDKMMAYLKDKGFKVKLAGG